MSRPPVSPSMLPPPPKRGAGVRRLNGIPKVMIFGAGLLVLGGFIYSYRVRLLQTTTATQEASEKHPEPASGSGITSNRPRFSELARPAVFHPAVTLPPAPEAPRDRSATTSGPSADKRPQQTEDMVTAARRAAWQAYYAQIAQIQQTRFAAAQDALKADTNLALTPAASGANVGQGNLPASEQQAVPGTAPGTGALGSYGGYLPPALPDQSGSREKQAFMNQTGNLGRDDVLMTTLRPPLSPFVVTAGDFILGVAVQGENSDAPGQFVGRVKSTVYDSATGLIPLIPENAKIIGTYDNVVTAGQSRLPSIITSIKYPDGSTLPIGAMPAADQSGFAGLHDIVHTHLGEKMLNAVLFALPGAALQLGVGGNNASPYGGYSAQQTVASSVAQQVGQVAQESARAGLAIPNTVIIRPGYEFTVQITKDIVFPGPYVDRRLGAPRGLNVSMPVMQ